MDTELLIQRTQELLCFRQKLCALGFDDETIAEAIRLGHNSIPVWVQQLQGCYIRDDGRRFPHFAVTGWWHIERVEGNCVRLLDKNGERFETSANDIKAVLSVNLEYVAKGWIQP